MNLICFPHYTCGGLLCDIFNNMFSEPNPHGGLGNFYHRVGGIGDTATVMTEYHAETLIKKLEQYKDTDYYIGTHCWPGRLDLNQFKKTIIVTTTTFRSKAYRWIRAYHHYFSKSDPWLEVSGQSRIDKERETAKNYLESFLPVNHAQCCNIEFSEVVDDTTEFRHLVGCCDVERHINRWRDLNNFLYSPSLWNSAPIQRLHEAEFEFNLNRYYAYQ